MENKTLKIILYTPIFIVTLVLAGILYNSISKNYTPQINSENSEAKENPAPDFTVYDENGGEVKLSSFEGKPVVVNFWATWCGPCRSELPAFENAYKMYREDITFLMVNLDGESKEAVDRAKNFVTTQGYTFPVCFDIDSDAATAYSTTAIPVTVFIDKNGNIAHKQIGAMTEQTLFYYIDSLIGE